VAAGAAFVLEVPMLRALATSGPVIALLIASPASSVTLDWTFVGDPDNACEYQGQFCYGDVHREYSIGTYEVTNAQYAQFLNWKAAADPVGLYNTEMGTFSPWTRPPKWGGIVRTGTPGSYTYAPIAGREDIPVNYVSLWDALRFANWLHNGQGNGDTESGAYTLLGGTPTPSNSFTVSRNSGATVFVPNVHEWYKAAYYDQTSASYFDYPTGSDTPTTCASPMAAANSANCNGAGGGGSDYYPLGDLTPVGSYPGSASPYGTVDQGGNVAEWVTPDPDQVYRWNAGTRGGYFNLDASYLAASGQVGATDATAEDLNLGFRVVTLPEPDPGVVVTLGVLAVALRRKPR
jgi:formylglycine-generating enzyme required for sulfatase activity